MRLFSYIVAAGLLGLILGVGGTALELRSTHDTFERPQFATSPIERGMHPVAHGPRRGRIEVINGETHDFGTMERETSQSHVFELKNQGAESVVLEKGEATCKCTDFTIDKLTLDPGEIAHVKVTWKPMSYDLNFSQRAKVKVPGDIDQPVIDLNIRGRVVQNVRPEPDSLVLGDFSNTTERTYTVRMYSYRLKDLTYQGVKYDEAETQPYLEVASSPLPTEDLAKEQGALSGFLVTVKIKPGLPLGPLRQTIRLITSESENGVVAIPMQGSVTSDVALRGPANYRSEIGLLDLDVVSRAVGEKAEMFLTVRGPLRDSTTAEIASVEPSSALEVTLGERKNLSGAVAGFPLRVRIRDDSPFLERLGPKADAYGKVVIRTNHPQAGELKFYVRFAVTK